MKILVSFLFLFIAIQFLPAQTSELDSLKAELAYVKDTQRVNVLNQIAYTYRRVDLDESNKYCEMAMDLSKELKYERGEAEATKTFGVIELFQSNYDEAIEILTKASKMADECGHLQCQIEAVNAIGVVYYYRSELDKSLEYYEKVGKLIEKKGDEAALANNMANKGLVYTLQGDYDRAMDVYMKAIEIREKLGDKTGVADIYGSFGNNYYYLGDYEKAAEYYHMELEIRREINDVYGLISPLNNLGTLYKRLEQFDKAKKYLKETVELSEEFNNMKTLSNAYNNLGHVYLYDDEDYEKALELYLKDLGIKEQIKDRNGMAIANINISLAYYKLEQYDRGLNYCIAGCDIAEEEGLLFSLEGGYRILMDYYDKLGDYKKAYEIQTEYIYIRDSLYDMEKLELTEELNEKYESEKKEQTIKLLEKEDEINELTIKKQEADNEAKAMENMILYAAIGLFVVVFVVIYLLIRQRQKKALHQKTIEEKKNRLKAIIETQETERERIASDLHDGVGQLLSAASMNFSKLAGQLKEDNKAELTKVDSSIGILNDAVNEVRNLSHQMMPRTLNDIGLVGTIESLLHKSFSGSDIKYQFEHHNIPEDLENSKKIGLYRICQELVGNAIKHADPNNISISLIKTKEAILLVVEDDGKGFQVSNQDGMGMKNILSRTEAMGGTFNIEPGPTKGTVATVKVPV